MTKSLVSLPLLLAICAFALWAADDPMKVPRNIPNLQNFKWLEEIYSQNKVKVYRGKSKDYIYTEHLGVWNSSGEPVKLKIKWEGFDDDKQRSFETDPIASSDEPRITLLRTPGYKNDPGPDDDSVAFKKVWINDTFIDLEGAPSR